MPQTRLYRDLFSSCYALLLLILCVGSIGPWLNVQTGTQTSHLSGLHGDGVFMLALGVFSFVFFLRDYRARTINTARTLTWIGLGTSLFALVLLGVDYGIIQQGEHLPGQTVHIGWGLYTVLASQACLTFLSVARLLWCPEISTISPQQDGVSQESDTPKFPLNRRRRSCAKKALRQGV